MNEAEKYLAAHKSAAGSNGGDRAFLHSATALDGLGRQGASGSPGSIGKLAGLALVSGLFAIVSAIARQISFELPVILPAVLVAPPVEEILKVAFPIMVLEHRAKWLSRGTDLLWFAMGSALVFSVVENLLYVFVYIESPTAGILAWRWIACMAMHVAASGLAGIGLMKAHERGLRTNQKPRFVLEWRWLAAAIAVHMAFNAVAVFSAFL